MSLSVSRIVVTVGAVVALGLAAAYIHYGTISPCGIIKQKARDAAAKQGGFIAAFGSAVPDSVLDALIRARLGAETPDRCLMALLKGKPLGDNSPERAPPPPQ